MMNWGRQLSAIAALSLVLAGCDGPRGISAADSFASTSPAATTSGHQAYRLALGDKVKITVFNEPDMSGEFQVNSTGNIPLPLAGEVPAVNKTIDELKKAVIAKLARKYVNNPRVSIEVTTYRPINVVGEVKNAGQYPYRPGLTMSDVVAMAGGYTYRANTHTLYVRHVGARGEQSVELDRGPPPVLPGDNVRVPERYF
jgi:polysaccharide export outer membrane protein